MTTLIITILTLLTIDIFWNRWYIKTNQPKKDYWKLLDKGLIMLVALAVAIPISLHMNGTVWRIVFLIGFLPAYSFLFDVGLNLLLGHPWYYLSPNHFPDKYILQMFQNGKIWHFFLACIVLFSSGLFHYFNSYNIKKHKS